MAHPMLRVKTTGWDKSLSRSAIAQPLRSDELIERFVVSQGGRLLVHCIGWDEYWSVARDAMPPGSRRYLDMLCRARRAYIESGYDLMSAPSYYRQASLSDYFRSLRRITRGCQEEEQQGQSIFFPLRRFNSDSLMLDDQTSILAQLAEVAELVVIEDVDLTADLLREHLEANTLDHLVASDVTDRVRMQSANLLCVSRRKHHEALPGRRIW